MRRAWAWLLAAVLALTAGCTASPTSTEPPKDLPSADAVVAALVSGLAKLDVTSVPFVYAATDAQAELKTITSGLGAVRPEITADAVRYNATDSTASVALKYHFAFQDDGWRYEAPVALNLVGTEWRVAWAPTIVHPQLTNTTRLRYRRTMPTRAAINGSDGLAVVEETPVVRVGIDKANLDKAKWDASARQLAGILSMDAEAYAKKVAASGEKAFVIAKTVRQGDLPPSVSNVPGLYLQDTKAMLALNDTFASGLLGVTGEATAEIIAKSNGAVVEGDIVGLTGLQQRHDAQLRGTPGHKVELVARPTPSPSPGAGASPTAKATAKPSASATPNATVLFEQQPVPGKPLALTLNAETQLKAESVLKDQPDVAAIVVIKPSTGEVMAAANSPASGANPYATTGGYPPGSTFKIVTSLALLRKGLSPSSTVNCTASYAVAGQTFTNYDGYSDANLGKIPLSKAFSESCNTAFMRAGEQVSAAELAAAAGSLGFGIDYNPGFASFYGQVPVTNNSIATAASFIGQGQVTASPMSMAAVVASVASGKTVVPWMVKGTQPASKAQPLSEAEAGTLRSLMGGVVNGGTARALQGVVEGAKTGTAQFGTTAPYKHHAWLVAWHGDVAVAAFVYDGVSGSTSAAPLVKAFFS